MALPNGSVSRTSAERTAQLAATVAAPLDPASADAPQVLHWPGRRLLVQRGDTELVVRDLDGEGTETRFPAPWPRRYGSTAVSPAADVAVFAGVHALRAVDPTGAVRWEIRHGCWSAAVCAEAHASFSEYADDRGHDHADTGSAAFSSDGKLLWAHVRNYAGHEVREEWLVLDPADGRVLARAETATVGASSYHFAHPDPAYMGLTVAEGEEDSPVLWGHWEGTTLTVQRFVEEVLLAVSPSGEHFLTTDPGQWSLYLHRADDGTELRRLDADEAVPPVSSDDTRVGWGYEAAFPYDDRAVVGTEYDAQVPRHWLVDTGTMSLDARITYPFPVSGSPRSAGPGGWHTVSRDGSTLHLWSLPHGE
ncbi:hypothetical protein ACGF7U_18595 [Micromonospora sp. NPDC047670]|uniref:hypothetical protein n=1 Tax=Micromonospora sp. NPDC047670 TaxID=3364252 RepID=UPI003716E845